MYIFKYIRIKNFKTKQNEDLCDVFSMAINIFWDSSVKLNKTITIYTE